MLQIQYTAFHIDFSTLDIEKGQVSLVPSSFTMVVQPHDRPGHITLPPEGEQKTPSSDRSVSPPLTTTPPSFKKPVSGRRGS